MKHALYPKRFGDSRPYCGSKDLVVENEPDGLLSSAEGLTVAIGCVDCGCSHYLHYRVTQVSLEDHYMSEEIRFYYPLAELEDQRVQYGRKSRRGASVLRLRGGHPLRPAEAVAHP